MKSTIIFCCILVITGCVQPQDGQSTQNLEPAKPGSMADIQFLTDLFKTYPNIGIEKTLGHASGQIRPAAFSIDNTLPRLHTWFVKGRGLESLIYGNDTVFVLHTIPDSVLEDLKSVTFDSNINSGFSIFQYDFWQGIQSAQREGIQVGFFDANSSIEVNGMYIQDRKMILVDIISNRGTLIHELRHHAQYQRLFKRSTAGNESLPNTLTNDCRTQFSRFFGELDATTAELPLWNGVFQQFETHADESVVTSAVKSDNYFCLADEDAIALKDLIFTNLDYPRAASQWVPAEPAVNACPKILTDVMFKITAETDLLNKKVGGVALKLYSLRERDLQARCKIERQSCQTQVNASSTNSSCEKNQQVLDSILIQVPLEKDQGDAIFKTSQQDRIQNIRESLSALPQGMAIELCRTTLGFDQYYPCDLQAEHHD